MDASRKSALIASGYRPYGTTGTWAKPFGCGLFIYFPETDELAQVVKDFHGKVSTNHRIKFEHDSYICSDEANKKVDPIGFLGFISAVEREYREFPMVGTFPLDRFAFLNADEWSEL